MKQLIQMRFNKSTIDMVTSMKKMLQMSNRTQIVKQAIVGSIEPGELERIEAGDEAVSDIPGSEEVHQPFAGLSAMLKHDDDPDKEH